ncbi:MAG: hypothetical protein PHI83_10430 [Sphaerochaetaceae bacterium]|nr:hypothetical protein [Sphaerochaetaceae bacterium]
MLDAQTLSKQLCAFTYHKLKNEKLFPKRDRWLISTPIANAAFSAFCCIRRANRIRLASYVDPALLQKRLELQIEARGYYDTLFSLIEIAQEELHFNLDDSDFEFWLKSIDSADAVLLKWNESDTRRIAEL